MDFLITTLFVIGLLGVLWCIVARVRKFKSVLGENGFVETDQCPEAILSFCKKLFDCKAVPPFYRGTISCDFGEDAWIVSLETGSDDPSKEVFISGEIDSLRVDFALAVTEGVKKTKGLFGPINKLEAPFKSAGFNLLPDEKQPFLQAHRGLVAYSNDNTLNLK